MKTKKQKAEGGRREAAAARGAGGGRARRPSAKRVVFALLLLLPPVFCLLPPALAQAPDDSAGEVVVEGRQAGDVFGMGRTVRVRGGVRGVIAFGGDVIVEGRVEGDAAAVGGSVIQRPGSYVGGDVMVFGGAYRDEAGGAGRGPTGRTMMFAGYEEELRELARNPAGVLTPRLTPAFVGWRVLAVLFWFIVSLALTAATPGAVSRAAARLQMTSLRVALIGVVGALVVGPGATAALRFLPPMVGGLVFVTALLLLLVSYLFGRVVVHAVTGRWLQRVLLREGRRSETAALLLGAAFWAVALALPFVWPVFVLGLVVVSLGLALTAPYRLVRKRG
ncbi:MAG TPA: hypothetical protein VN228_08345 [Pyrinomonadaceae bacterium]|nr:hypothetical protein [Pyrinomonadaceae bacterium]